MKEIIFKAIKDKNLTKLIFSKSSQSALLKIVCRLIEVKGQTRLAFESFYVGGKTSQINVELNEVSDKIDELFPSVFKQINLITQNGTAEIKVSKKGKILISKKFTNSSQTDNCELNHNGRKNYIIDGDNKVDFLVELGVQDGEGRIHDKKQSKFRQINRFLEIVKDVQMDITRDDSELYILDLCCGKSYLSFAIYYYFAVLNGYKVVMDCVDLKKDVIDYCNKVKEKLNYTGLNFICDDVLNFKPRTPPNLTVSLHACDIATDIVIKKGIDSNSKVILSTPCCHHEVYNALKKQGNDFDLFLEHSILKTKFADALTDNIRCKILEIKGYKTEAIELIDPDETPKNVLIRAVKNSRIDQEKQQKNLEKVKNICKIFNITPYLYKSYIE